MYSVSNDPMRPVGQQVRTPGDDPAGVQSTDARELSSDLKAARRASTNATELSEGAVRREAGLPPEVARNRAISRVSNASLERAEAMEYFRRLVLMNGCDPELRETFVDAVNIYAAAARQASSMPEDEALKTILFGISAFDDSKRLMAIRIFADNIPKDRRNFGNAECLNWLRELFDQRDDVAEASETLEIVSSAAEVEGAKEDMWNAVREGVAQGRDALMPESFLALTEEGRREVAKLTARWVMAPINQETTIWLSRFTGSSVIKPYVKETISDEVRRLLNNSLYGRPYRGLLNQLIKLRMFAPRPVRPKRKP